MAGINDILRRSGYIDTSQAYQPRGLQVAAVREPGVFVQASADSAGVDSVLLGRMSLGILVLLIGASVAFYVWTKDVQGGG